MTFFACGDVLKNRPCRLLGTSGIFSPKYAIYHAIKSRDGLFQTGIVLLYVEGGALGYNLELEKSLGCQGYTT